MADSSPAGVGGVAVAKRPKAKKRAKDKKPHPRANLWKRKYPDPKPKKSAKKKVKKSSRQKENEPISRKELQRRALWGPCDKCGKKDVPIWWWDTGEDWDRAWYEDEAVCYDCGDKFFKETLAPLVELNRLDRRIAGVLRDLAKVMGWAEKPHDKIVSAATKLQKRLVKKRTRVDGVLKELEVDKIELEKWETKLKKQIQTHEKVEREKAEAEREEEDKKNKEKMARLRAMRTKKAAKKAAKDAAVVAEDTTDDDEPEEKPRRSAKKKVKKKVRRKAKKEEDEDAVEGEGLAVPQTRKTKIRKKAKGGGAPCPKCQAKTGDPCTTSGGNPIKKRHEGRE